jgi:hypothetical protein
MYGTDARTGHLHGRSVNEYCAFSVPSTFFDVQQNDAAMRARLAAYRHCIELAWLSERLKRAIGMPMALPLSAPGNKTALPRGYLGSMNHSVEGNPIETAGLQGEGSCARLVWPRGLTTAAKSHLVRTLK